MTTRRCKCNDKYACQKCFDFSSIQLVKDRVKRMDRIYHIEQHITEPSASKTGYFEVSNFLRSNVSNASPALLILRERCVKYISHRDWVDQNMSALRTYDAIDNNGKDHRQTWLNKVSQMYVDDPSMKTSFLHALTEFTLSRYKGDITAHASPKLIGFSQTLHALNPRIYCFFSNNFGGYNERTLLHMNAKQSSDIPVINREAHVIKMRAKIGYSRYVRIILIYFC